MDRMAKSKGPEVLVIMFGPSQGCVYHHGARSPNSVFDGVFSHPIVVVSTDSAMLYPLSLRRKLGCEFLGRIDSIIRAVSMNLNTDCGSLSFKTELGLNSLCASQSDLVNNGQLSACGIAEDSSAPIFLGGEIVASCRELSPKERGLILI
jgi:hypothetical protein